MTLALVPWMGLRAEEKSAPAVPVLAQRDLRGWGKNEVRVGLLLLLVAALNAIDLAYTLFAYRIGMLDEMNPLAAAYLSAGLERSFICYKLLMVIAGSVMLWRVRKSMWAGPACWVIVGVYVGLGWLWYEWVREVMSMYEMRIALAF
jgi:hypothetical protein